MNNNDDFEMIFADTYPNFTKDLVKHYGNLTYKELRLCMFIRMGYPTHKILEKLKISSNTLANLRSGIRKKMNLTRNQNLTNTIICI